MVTLEVTYTSIAHACDVDFLPAESKEIYKISPEPKDYIRTFVSRNRWTYLQSIQQLLVNSSPEDTYIAGLSPLIRHLSRCRARTLRPRVDQYLQEKGER